MKAITCRASLHPPRHTISRCKFNHNSRVFNPQKEKNRSSPWQKTENFHPVTAFPTAGSLKLCHVMSVIMAEKHPPPSAVGTYQ